MPFDGMTSDVTGRMDTEPDFYVWYMTMKSNTIEAHETAIERLTAIEARCKNTHDKYLIEQIRDAFTRALRIPHYPNL